MMDKVDRIIVVVNDLDNAEKNYSGILGAERLRDYHSTFLDGDVRVMQLGASQVELCQPTSDGLAASRLERSGEGLLFGGVSVSNLDKFAAHLDAKGIEFTQADRRIYTNDDKLYGLPLVVSASSSQSANQANPLTAYLYELTMVLKTQWSKVADDYTDYFQLDADRRVGITFPRFGYEGALLMFNDEHLDRIELSEAHDPAFPMGRFSAKHGDGLYMCYVETNDLAQVIERLEHQDAKYVRRTRTPVEHDGLWVHPSALNGVLMGVSRKTLAWQWSGKPERVQPLD